MDSVATISSFSTVLCVSSSGITTLPAAAASWVACGFIMCSKVNDSFESQLQMGRRLFVPIIGFGFEPLTLKPSHRPTTFNAGPTRRGRDAERTKITNHSSERCSRYAHRTELASTDSGFDGTSRSRFCRSSTQVGGSIKYVFAQLSARGIKSQNRCVCQFIDH